MPFQLFLDTETSGLPLTRESYQHPGQPWIVQLAAVLSDDERIYQQISLIIRAEGRAIEQEASETHGFTAEICDAVGVRESYAGALLINLTMAAERIVCHNAAFDRLVAEAMLFRIWGAKGVAYFDGLPSFCTMREGAEAWGEIDHRIAFCFRGYPGEAIIQRLKEHRCRWDPQNRWWHGRDEDTTRALANELHVTVSSFTEPKWPSLMDLHTYLFSTGFDGAHDALADVLACRRCYYALRAQGIGE